jgi:hypothetical protein
MTARILSDLYPAAFNPSNGDVSEGEDTPNLRMLILAMTGRNEVTVELTAASWDNKQAERRLSITAFAGSWEWKLPRDWWQNELISPSASGRRAQFDALMS